MFWGAATVLGVSNQKPLPFKLDVSLEIPKWRASTFWSKEPETLTWIDRYLSKETNINILIDVGANIGIYSLYATAVNRNVKVFAIEPIQETYFELVKNIELNSVSEQIEPINAALSFMEGSGQMIGSDGRAGSSGAQLFIGDGSNGSSISTMTGDQILNTQVSSRAIVKIDTDGNEFDVLCGFKNSFEKNLVESILVETTMANESQIDEILKSNNFTEDVTYLEIEGHSNHRRIKAGNKERTKIYSQLKS